MKSITIYTAFALILLSSFVMCTTKTVDEIKKFKAINYITDDSKFPNPERGFYKQVSSDLGTGNGVLNESTLRSYRNSNITLILRMYYLKNFKSSALTTKALTDFDSDMATIRRSGVKCILRFAYSEDENEPDAPLEIIIQHLDQLKPFFEKNADVIAIMQAGFIGAWGEGFYSSNGLNSSAGRYAVYNKILNTLPTKRMMQVRSPSYKREFFQRSAALKQDEAFTMQNVARVGHHNDCFLASPNDYGTYNDVSIDKAYLNKDCLYVPIGGETCPPSGIDPADATKAQFDMRYLRWTYLNEDYYRGVNDLWIVQGGMDNILRELGYRFQLISGEYTEMVAPGNAFSARVILKNIGYASLFNPRLVELVLKNIQSKEVYKVKLDVEPRLWKPLVETEIEAVIGIPQDMPNGQYELYLNMPDPEETLYTNPDYSVRFANANVWEETTGFNKLGVTIQVAPENKTEPYSGNLTFKK